MHLARLPLCVECGRPGTDVDHIKPHKGNQALFWDSSNWQTLCKPCHSHKTATKDGGFGRG
ncbi:HNH endonuclease signature motif containing protein [Bacillus sp. V5-8f]|uniref:HNH endonuclease signature motif containing protein n=1 Tax=Bacillus sp. V5-8f TaxID=2053044 RepID=UPI0027E424B9|nr:HNH endonuclease signature motif containing protein [Bacillus sp. V5-8f]